MGTKQWYHVVGTWATDGSGGGTAKAYINGAEVGSATGSYSWTSTGNSFKIGNSSTESYYWQGLINECIAYNKTLSLAEVQALANTDANGGPLPPNPMSLADSGNVVGYWRNDGDVTWTDRSSNSNYGTVVGSPVALLFKQGINGQKNVNTGRDNQGFPLLYQNNGAIGFVSNSVDLGNVVSFDNTDNFTVEAWFKAALDGSGNGFSYQPIISKEGSAEFGYAIKLDYNVAGGPWLYGLVNGTTNRYQYSSALNAGQWYHACVTFSSSANYITVFIDGAQNHGPYSVQGAFSGTTNTNSLKLGNGSYSTVDFRGQIGSSKIYNRLLSQAEIKQNYNAQKSRFT